MFMKELACLLLYQPNYRQRFTNRQEPVYLLPSYEGTFVLYLHSYMIWYYDMDIHTNFTLIPNFTLISILLVRTYNTFVVD